MSCPPKLPADGNRPPLLLRGLDSLYVSYYLTIQGSALDFDELVFLKERVRQSRVDEFAEVRLGTEGFALKPYGRYPYAHVLVNDAFEVRVSEHLRPACHVQFYSVGLWTHGLDTLAARFRHWCQSLRLSASAPEVVARADWAFDYHLPTWDFNRKHFVSYATKRNEWDDHEITQSIQLGVGSTVVRVYDKVAEIEQVSEEKAFLFELWGRKEEVTRVEFQVRRDRLDSAGIKTLDDLQSLQGDLLRELATGHTSLRRPSADTNRARWPLHPLWLALLDDIATIPQTGLVRTFDPAASLDWRLFQQGKSLYGSLKGLGALLSVRDGSDNPLTLDDVLAALPGVLTRHHNRLVWPLDVERRIKGFRLGQW